MAVDPLYRPLSSRRKGSKSTVTTTKKIEAPAASAGPLVGRNYILEKPYLRLTTYADPLDVRPLPVLIKALAHIKNRYATEEDFEWANEQLKSLRQDLTVQRVRNLFVLEGMYRQ